MALLNRIFLSFLPTGHRITALRENPTTPAWPEWVALMIFLALTSWLWPIAAIAEAAVRLSPAAAMSELKYFALDLLLLDVIPVIFFVGIWFVLGRDLNTNQKLRLGFMTWLPAVLIRAILQGIPLLAPQVAYLPIPVFPLPQIVALAEALVNLGLLVTFLRTPTLPALHLPKVVGPAFVGSQLAVAGLLFWFPLAMQLPRFIVAPDFTIPQYNGGTCSLSAHRGKPVLLEFWSTGCPHCRHLVPELEKLQKSLGSELQILAVHVGGGPRAEGKLKEMFPEGTHYPVCVDDGTAARLYKALKEPHRPQGIPHLILIDRNGIIRQSMSGFREADLLESEVRKSGILR